MPLIDPDDLELSTLRALADFSGQRVLEIGAGDARLAWPLAGQAALWLALDNDRAELGVAADDQRAHPLGALQLLEADGRAMPLGAGSFDLAFFSWSLCCVPRAGMGTALAEAGRVLRPGGQLLDVHPTADPIRLEVWLALRPGVVRDPPNPDDYRRVALGVFDEPEEPHDFAGASAAVEAASKGNDFEAAARVVFDYPYFFDDLNALTDYLEDNAEMDLASDDLLERAALALNAATTPSWLVMIQPVAATSLRKR